MPRSKANICRFFVFIGHEFIISIKILFNKLVTKLWSSSLSKKDHGLIHSQIFGEESSDDKSDAAQSQSRAMGNLLEPLH